MVKETKKYSETHEWVKIEEGIATVGITRYAQKELGEIVYVEFPEVGEEIEAGSEVVVLESTKAAADIYSPVSGKILEVNDQLKTDQTLINEEPETKGWLFKAELRDALELDKLYTDEGYAALVGD